MDIFHTLTLQDKETFNNYCYKSNFTSYEYTFASLYLWRNLSKTTFAIIDNTLIVKKNEDYYGNFFMIPYNYNPSKLNSIIELLLSYEKDSNNYSNSNDLSNNMSYEEFIKKLDIVNEKIYNCLINGGRHAILVGDVRKKGVYYSILKVNIGKHSHNQ